MIEKTRSRACFYNLFNYAKRCKFYFRPTFTIKYCFLPFEGKNCHQLNLFRKLQIVFTFSLFTEIAFPCNSRFASPLDFRKPDFSDNKSIMLLPKTSDFELPACGTPSKICKNNSSSNLQIFCSTSAEKDFRSFLMLFRILLFHEPKS